MYAKPVNEPIDAPEKVVSAVVTIPNPAESIPTPLPKEDEARLATVLKATGENMDSLIEDDSFYIEEEDNLSVSPVGEDRENETPTTFVGPNTDTKVTTIQETVIEPVKHHSQQETTRRKDMCSIGDTKGTKIPMHYSSRCMPRPYPLNDQPLVLYSEFPLPVLLSEFWWRPRSWHQGITGTSW